MEVVLTSWCDILASTPSVGFGFDWRMMTGDSVLGNLSRLLDPLVANERPKFTIKRADPFSVTITREDGFSYGIEPSKAYVTFQHTMRAKAVSGAAPVMEMLSRPMPYTKLLPEVSDMLVEMTLALPHGVHGHGRKLQRVGIVSTTHVDEGEVPPGVKHLIEWMCRPWSTVDSFSIQATAVIARHDRWTDRCIFNLVKPEIQDELMTIIFDWQRTFAMGQQIGEDSLRRIVKQAQKDALVYFEEIGEGNRIDERLNGSAT